MKLVLITALCLLASCKDRSREPPPASGPAPGSGAPPAAAPSTAPPAAAASGAPLQPPAQDVCRISFAALDQAKCTAPEVQKDLLETKKVIGRIIEALGKMSSVDPRQFQVMCAQMLVDLERTATKLKCTLALDAGQRKQVTGLLDEWYAQRTPVSPTGDAASDAVIARIVAVRDAACECRDAACLDRVDKQLVQIGNLPGSAPQAARTLGGKLLEDAGRCAARVRLLDQQPR